MEEVKVVEVNPELAAEWLKLNTVNRHISKNMVTKYANDMRAGNWAFTGDSIKFNGDGTLLDGQHRLRAIIDSGLTQKLLIVKGLSKDVFQNLDIGKKRNFADILSVGNDNKYTSALAAAINGCYLFDLGVFNTWKTSPFLLSEYYKNNPGILSSLNFVLSIRKESIVNYGVVISMHYLFSRINKQMADEFITKVVTGENLTRLDVAYLLREKILHAKARKLTINKKSLVALFARAWNYYRMNETPRSLNYHIDTKIPKLI